MRAMSMRIDLTQRLALRNIGQAVESTLRSPTCGKTVRIRITPGAG